MVELLFMPQMEKAEHLWMSMKALQRSGVLPMSDKPVKIR